MDLFELYNFLHKWKLPYFRIYIHYINSQSRILWTIMVDIIHLFKALQQVKKLLKYKRNVHCDVTNHALPLYVHVMLQCNNKKGGICINTGFCRNTFSLIPFGIIPVIYIEQYLVWYSFNKWLLWVNNYVKKQIF